MSKKMIVIAGKNNIAVHALEVLISKVGADNILVVPNATDTGNDGWQRSLKNNARLHNVKIGNITDIQSDSVELFLSLEYDKIIKPDRFPADKLFNIHFSCLPKYKGMYTSVWPILNGDESSGVTLHKIDRGIDTGFIVDQKIFSLQGSDRCSDLYFKYIEASIQLFDKNIDNLINNKYSAVQQSALGASYFAKSAINFKNLALDFNCTAWQLQRQIYAYTFREYQIPEVQGKAVVEVEITTHQSTLKPGTFFDESDRSITVACIDYDAILYFDGLDFLLKSIGNMNVADVKNAIFNIAGINDRNSYGWSPIIVAAYYGNIDVVKYLIEQGANVNDRNYKGTSVLMYAKDFCLKAGNIELFAYLISCGADTEIKDYSGKKIVNYLSNEEIKILGL